VFVSKSHYAGLQVSTFSVMICATLLTHTDTWTDRFWLVTLAQPAEIKQNKIAAGFTYGKCWPN